jgi:hypothetical protein
MKLSNIFIFIFTLQLVPCDVLYNPKLYANKEYISSEAWLEFV